MEKKSRFVIILALTLILPVAMMMLIAMTGVGRNAVPSRPEGPCDIYAAAGYPCVTAHSSTRALYASYNGPLYQVKRQSDGKTLDIGVVQPGEDDPGGYADAAAQDAFCANTLCWITTIYDQSGNGNHLVQAPPGTFRGPAKGGFNTLPIADMAPITIMGHKAYATMMLPVWQSTMNRKAYTWSVTERTLTAAVASTMATRPLTAVPWAEVPWKPSTSVLPPPGVVAAARAHGSCPIWKQAFIPAITQDRT